VLFRGFQHEAGILWNVNRSSQSLQGEHGTRSEGEAL
jgi:hypothetical protein